MILKVRTIDSTQELTGVVSFAVKNNGQLGLQGSAGTLSFTASMAGYNAWYSSFLTKKQYDMFYGGSWVAEGGPVYDFEEGLQAVWVCTNNVPYIKTIQGISPDNTGNIEFLPSTVVDVLSGSGRTINSNNEETVTTGLSITRIPKPSLLSYYQEINRMLWALYHALVYLNHRMCVFNPNQYEFVRKAAAESGAVSWDEYRILGRCMGTIPNYMANLARFNCYAWDSSVIAKSVGSGAVGAGFIIGIAADACPIAAGVLTASGSLPLSIQYTTIYLLDAALSGKEDDTSRAVGSVYRPKDFTSLPTTNAEDSSDKLTYICKHVAHDNCNDEFESDYNRYCSGDGRIEAYGDHWNKFKVSIAYPALQPFESFQAFYAFGPISLPAERRVLTETELEAAGGCGDEAGYLCGEYPEAGKWFMWYRADSGDVKTLQQANSVYADLEVVGGSVTKKLTINVPIYSSIDLQ